MYRSIIILSVFGALQTAEVNVVDALLNYFAPKIRVWQKMQEANYPPTAGEVWPKPQKQNKDITFYTLHPEIFNITVTTHTCEILVKAVDRLRNVVRDLQNMTSQTHAAPSHDVNYQGIMKYLLVELTSPCEQFPHLEMSEKYQLSVTQTATLTSSSIWGILRGVETFSQLFYLSDRDNEIRINATQITDHPAYAHRGLLLNTARTFIPVDIIYSILDAMAMNKMNVFHWHIVDDQSFPYKSESFPKLSQYGAFSKHEVYTNEDVKSIVLYARDRGIRVVPEFDVPAHATSWGSAYSYIITKCRSSKKATGMMNPVNYATYKLLSDLYAEIQELFPDKYIHIGGDDADLYCWKTNPEIFQYMSQSKIKSVQEVLELFVLSTIELLRDRSVPIVWQDVFEQHVRLPKNTIVQVRKNDSQAKMRQILNASYRVLYSAAWNLDTASEEGSFEKFYEGDPRSEAGGGNKVTLNIVGGEACMWGIGVNGSNIFNRIWPLTCAVAEKLWIGSVSGLKEAGLPKEVYQRLHEHTCRMLGRGLPISPTGYCPYS